MKLRDIIKAYSENLASESFEPNGLFSFMELNISNRSILCNFDKQQLNNFLTGKCIKMLNRIRPVLNKKYDCK